MKKFMLQMTVNSLDVVTEVPDDFTLDQIVDAIEKEDYHGAIRLNWNEVTDFTIDEVTETHETDIVIGSNDQRFRIVE